MTKQMRVLLDRSHTGVNLFAICFMIAALVVLLAPIVVKGLQAFIFQGTIEYRKMMVDEYGRGNRDKLQREIQKANHLKQPVYDYLNRFSRELEGMSFVSRRKYRKEFKELKEIIRELFGPLKGDSKPLLLRKIYGQTRWDRAEIKLKEFLFQQEWDYSNPDDTKLLHKPRVNLYRGTSLEPLFDYMKNNTRTILGPGLTFYLNFLFDKSKDAHFFGGIFPEVLGTIYLTLLSMVFAVPFGITAAIYLTEFAGDTKTVSILRTCINTLAGVPSIVFGLFGLAFFINSVKVSHSKSVLAGALTLSILILPTIIRASEEAILAVPKSYKEAAFGLGSSHLTTIFTIILPAALPGILTGIIISMGRAAGETAPIIFTAAVSVGNPLRISEIFTQPTPALSWNIYNISTEHEAVGEIRHVQYGMVLTLIGLVLMLNFAAVFFRARISKKLRG